jgi:seryl-tRNA synthetase
MIKEPNLREVATPIIREVIIEKDIAIDHFNDWITWVLILIIVILLGYAVYQYFLPPSIVVDKTQESILSTQIERLTTLNSELENRLERALNNIRALHDGHSSLLSDLKGKISEISRLETDVNTFSSKIEYLQSKVSSYMETISKLRVEISTLEKETVPSVTFEATGKLLAKVQSELHTISVSFNNLANTVRESGHVPNFLETDQY